MHLKRLVLVTAILTCGVGAQPSGTGALAGRVVLRTGGGAVRKAAVYLTWHGAPQSIALAVTDGDGRFVFDGLPAGKYSLNARRESVGGGEYGEFVTLEQGQRRGGLIIRISQNASISGVVFDADGDAAQGALVQVMMEAYPRGTRQLATVSGATTNLKGEYQVSGLAPGKYYLLLQNAGQQSEPGRDDQVFRSQYYGGATDWRRAAAVMAGSGQQIRGIDIRATTTRAVRVTGHVRGAPEWQQPPPESSGAAQPVPFVNIMLQPVGEDMSAQGQGAGAGPPEYRFEMGSVTPGHYRLTASVRAPGGRMLYSRQLIEVGEQPADLEVALAPGVDLQGTVRYEGDPALRPGAFQVELVTAELSQMMPPSAGKVNAEGTFTISGVPPGIWDINPGPIPKGGFLKSMWLGEQDVLTEDMEIGPGTNALLNIVVSSRGGKVSGELEGQTARRRPATIMLAPLGKYAAVMSFFMVTESDADGKFELEGLTPGKYELFAFEKAPQGDFRGPDIVKKMSALGDAVDVVEGVTQQVKAKVITPEQLKEVLQ